MFAAKIFDEKFIPEIHKKNLEYLKSIRVEKFGELKIIIEKNCMLSTITVFNRISQVKFYEIAQARFDFSTPTNYNMEGNTDTILALELPSKSSATTKSDLCDIIQSVPFLTSVSKFEQMLTKTQDADGFKVLLNNIQIWPHPVNFHQQKMKVTTRNLFQILLLANFCSKCFAELYGLDSNNLYELLTKHADVIKELAKTPAKENDDLQTVRQLLSSCVEPTRGALISMFECIAKHPEKLERNEELMRFMFEGSQKGSGSSAVSRGDPLEVGAVVAEHQDGNHNVVQDVESVESAKRSTRKKRFGGSYGRDDYAWIGDQEAPGKKRGRSNAHVARNTSKVPRQEKVVKLGAGNANEVEAEPSTPGDGSPTKITRVTSLQDKIVRPEAIDVGAVKVEQDALVDSPPTKKPQFAPIRSKIVKSEKVFIEAESASTLVSESKTEVPHTLTLPAKKTEKPEDVVVASSEENRTQNTRDVVSVSSSGTRGQNSSWLYRQTYRQPRSVSQSANRLLIRGRRSRFI